MGQISLGSDFLPELDRKKTQKAVESALEKYRLCKYLTFEERESTITAGYQERFHGPTNVTSDQTASVAIYNVDTQAARKAYCEKIERAVKRLHPKERLLIEERYMKEEYDGEYIKDYQVYNFVFNPPISEVTYYKIRWKAFYKLALHLNIAIEKEDKQLSTHMDKRNENIKELEVMSDGESAKDKLN